MGQINWKRVLLGGLVLCVVFNVLWAAAWFLFLQSDWQAALQALGRSFPYTASFIVFFLVGTLIAGIFAIWLYAAIRPRYGPGPKTAACASLALWLVGIALPTVMWCLALSFPPRLIVMSVVVGLVADVLATLAGAWTYQE